VFQNKKYRSEIPIVRFYRRNFCTTWIWKAKRCAYRCEETFSRALCFILCQFARLLQCVHFPVAAARRCNVETRLDYFQSTAVPDPFCFLHLRSCALLRFLPFFLFLRTNVRNMVGVKLVVCRRMQVWNVQTRALTVTSDDFSLYWAYVTEKKLVNENLKKQEHETFLITFYQPFPELCHTPLSIPCYFTFWLCLRWTLARYQMQHTRGSFDAHWLRIVTRMWFSTVCKSCATAVIAFMSTTSRLNPLELSDESWRVTFTFGYPSVGNPSCWSVERFEESDAAFLTSAIMPCVNLFFSRVGDFTADRFWTC